MADKATGSSGVLRLDVSESGLNPGANASTVSWALYLIEASTSNSSYSGGGISASVTVDGGGTLWSGTFGFDWRGAGNQSTLIASGSYGQGRNPDGTGAITVRGNIGNTGTSGAGGPTSVDQFVQLATLVVPPGQVGVPVASRISDSATQLTWTQTNPANGQPTNTYIDASVNNGDWFRLVNMGPGTSANVAMGANQKLQYRVYSANSAGQTGAQSNDIFGTPAAPTSVTAVKGSNLDVTVGWVNNVAYSEYNSEVWHGTVAAGVTTWDAAPLVTVASGVSSYTHAAPNSAQIHTYRVRAVAGGLQSSYAVSGNVQLLAAPNKPVTPAMPAFADTHLDLQIGWQHNPADTTPQKFYQFSYSFDGGATWNTTDKTASTNQFFLVPGDGAPAGTALTSRVRTWGSATTGGSEGTGASPWSDTRTVTFKSPPTVAITAPANGSVIHDSTISATLAFAQAEGAKFVKAQLQLKQGATLLGTLTSSVLNGIKFSTQAQNGQTYTIRARVQDSNGIWGYFQESTFSVSYLSPPSAIVTTKFLPDSGYGQVTITIPAPTAEQSEAVSVSLTRTINGVTENVLTDYPADAVLTVLDTTPVVNGTNVYKVTTQTALGAQATTTVNLVTTELRRAYLSKGTQYDNVIVFGGNLSIDDAVSVASDTIQAAGRQKPIGLYGIEQTVQIKVGSFIFGGFGSTIPQIRDLLLTPGKACYRDPSGRRVFGSVKGSIKYKKADQGDLSFTLTETS